MRIFRNFIIILIFSSCLLHANTYQSGDVVRLSENDTLANDLICAGRSIEIQGHLAGDLFSGSEQMTLDGTIEDDIIAAGRTVLIKGSVGDMVIAMGEKVFIDGEVGGDVLAFGGEVRFTERATVKGNVYVGAANVRLEGGQIGGWLKGGAGTVWLNGAVAGRVILETDEVDFGPDYQAGQGTKLTLPAPLDRENTAYVPEDLEIVIEEKDAFYESGFFYWSLISMFVTGLLLGLVFKQPTRNLLEYTSQNVLKNTGIGFLIVFLTPLAIALLIFPLITLPVALILAAIYLITLYVGLLFSGLFLGSYLFSLLQKGEALGSLVFPFVIGLIIIMSIAQIPIVGSLIKLVLICLGSGSLGVYFWSIKESSDQRTSA
jgi:hypothetical protein